MAVKDVKKVVLAYSGGLDTSVILRWLQTTYGCEVVTFTADLGQGEELGPARKKAEMFGVKEIFVDDLREEFVRDFVFPMFRANTVYEGQYLLGTSIARPLIAQRQIQIAEDLARQISAASSIPQISPGLTTDISQSLGSFVLIYDDSNKFVTGSGQVNGQYPVLPAGVFANVRKSGEDRLTWEPAPGTRVALVVTRYDNSTHSGFVAVGRSLREVEKRIDMLCLYVIAAWLVALVASFVLIAAVEMLSDRHYDPVV